jgi:replicative DNA helicase
MDGPNGSAAVPPWSEADERAVLGLAMYQRSAAGVVLTMLRPEDFYRPRHKVIFEAIKAVVATDPDATPDPVLVRSELERTGCLGDIGEPSLLTDLLAEAPMLSQTTAHAGNVKRRSQVRAVQALGWELMQAAAEVELDRCRQIVDQVRAVLGWAGDVQVELGGRFVLGEPGP